MKNSGIVRIVFLVTLFIVAVISILIFLGDSNGMDGPYLARKDKSDEALIAFQKGLSFDKYNPEVLSSYSSFLLSQSQSKNMTDVNQRKESLNEALNLASRALSVKPHDSNLFSLRADIYSSLGNNELSESDLRMAIENNKTLDLTSYMTLAQKYFDDKKYDDVVKVVDGVLRYYPVEIFHDYFLAGPDKGMLKFNIAILNNQKANALDKLNRKKEAQQARDLIKLY